MTWRAALACALVAPAAAQVPSACDLLTGPEAAAIVGEPLSAPRAEPPAEGQSECGHYPPGFDRSAEPERGLRIVLQRLADESDARAVYFSVLDQRRRVLGRQSRSAGAAVASLSDVQGLADAATLEVRAASNHATLTFYRGALLAQVTAWHTGDPGAAARAAAQRALSRLR